MSLTGAVAVLTGFVFCGMNAIVLANPAESAYSAQSAAQQQIRESKASQPAKKEQAPVKKPVVIDDWELILVNGENPLPDDYKNDNVAFENEKIDKRIYDYLDQMLVAAKDAGLNLWVASGYRDVDTQKALLKNAIANRIAEYGMTEKEARADALRTIAEPGRSEHHTGLAVDFNYVTQDFEDTEEYEWLSKYAVAYGFVQRYPSGKEKITGIDVEPWHYRYVGRENARTMNRLGLCLEEYIEYLKNKDTETK